MENKHMCLYERIFINGLLACLISLVLTTFSCLTAAIYFNIYVDAAFMGLFYPNSVILFIVFMIMKVERIA